LLIACTSEVITEEVQGKIDKAGFNQQVEAPVTHQQIVDIILP